MQGASLMAQPFDSTSLRLGGEAQPVTQSIGGTETNGYVDVSAARSGVLAYGNSQQGSAKLVWSDRTGKQSATIAEALPAQFHLSPDGNSVVLSRSSGNGTDYWVIDLVRNTPTRFTFSNGTNNATWSPDGKEIVYSIGLSQGLLRKPASGAGEPLTPPGRRCGRPSIISRRGCRAPGRHRAPARPAPPMPPYPAGSAVASCDHRPWHKVCM